MTLHKNRPAFRYHGAKWRIAPWIVSHFPAHRTYVEAFGGAAGVLLQKPRSHSEIYNDLDESIVTIFRVLQDPAKRESLLESLRFTPFSRSEFERAWTPADSDIEVARRALIRAEMGFGSAGASKPTTGFRTDTMREYGATPQDQWARLPDSLRLVAQRFTGVLIEAKPAIEVVKTFDSPATLHYVDPPYLQSTRAQGATGRARNNYRHEMTDLEHSELLDVLQALSGCVVLSTYPNDMYADRLRGWTCRERNARIAGGRGARVRKEQIWLNPACGTAGDLFA